MYEDDYDESALLGSGMDPVDVFMDMEDSDTVVSKANLKAVDAGYNTRSHFPETWLWEIFLIGFLFFYSQIYIHLCSV